MFQQKNSLFQKIIFAGLIVITLAVIVVLKEGVFDAGTYNPFNACRRKLSALGVAMQNYYDVYHTYPPSYTTDENGRPMHSWRALLLPYIDVGLREQQMKYNYEEPWNSPYNQQFRDKMPSAFCCPLTPEQIRKSIPSYAMITGQNTVGEGQNKILRYRTTILLIEIKNANFNWLEPVDIQLDQLQYAYKKNKNMPNLIGSYHDNSTRSFIVLACDGAVHFLSYKTTSIEVIKAMATIDGARTVIEKECKKTQMTYFEFRDDKSEKK
jgi:hypothetical protein